MPEEVVFETETDESLADVADYLRSVADRLDAGGGVTLRGANDEVTLDPPASVTFEVKVERETGADPVETSVEFELEWREGEDSQAFEVA